MTARALHEQHIALWRSSIAAAVGILFVSMLAGPSAGYSQKMLALSWTFPRRPQHSFYCRLALSCFRHRRNGILGNYSVQR